VGGCSGCVINVGERTVYVGALLNVTKVEGTTVGRGKKYRAIERELPQEGRYESSTKASFDERERREEWTIIGPAREAKGEQKTLCKRKRRS